MNHYETVYIIHPAIQEGRLNDIVSKFKSKIESHKGKLLYVENWGKKKLSYPIDKQKYGTYVMCQYSLDGGFVKDLSKELGLNPNILRYLVTKIEQENIKEGASTLDKIEENKVKEVKPEKVKEEVTVEEAKEVKPEKVKEEVTVEEVKEEANNTSGDDNNEDVIEERSGVKDNQEADNTEKEGVK
jgi:small subunit ribosomal protein S6